MMKALLLISILILNDGPVKKSISMWLWGGCLFGEAWQISDWILGWYLCFRGFPGGLVVKNLPAMQEPQVWSLGWEDTLEKEMATYSSILAWEIPQIEDPGRLQSTGSQKSQTRLSNFTSLTSYFITGEGNGNLFQYSCLENPMDRGAWQTTVHEVAKSQRQLKWFTMQ